MALEPIDKIVIFNEDMTTMIGKQPHSPVVWESHDFVRC